MKAIMISIRPRHVADILNHKKLVEIRKTFPKEFLNQQNGYTVYIYCTKQCSLARLNNGSWNDTFITEKEINEDNFKRMYSGYDGKGKVVAKFKLNRIGIVSPLSTKYWHQEACLSEEELEAYLNGEQGYAWCIDDLEIFEMPKDIKGKAPQSWCYVEDSYE